MPHKGFTSVDQESWNLVTNDSVALLFLIPGLSETLRVNGNAELVTDPHLCEAVAVNGRSAKVAVVVTVAEIHFHCAKSLRRASLWSPESWLDSTDLPSVACMVRDHAGIDVDPSVIADDRERHLRATCGIPAADLARLDVTAADTGRGAFDLFL